MNRNLLYGALLMVGVAGTALADPFPGGYVAGDVFAAVGNGQVKVFTPTGTLVGTLNDLSGSTFTTGMAFDAAGNLYVTNFSTNNIAKFNNTGGLVATAWATTPSTPESIVSVATGTYAGKFFVAGPSAATINEFDATGALVHTFNVAGGNGTGGTDWIDFKNTDTIYYDGEGNLIKSYNITTNTQGPDFATSVQSSNFALRVIPTGAFAGDVLIADSGVAELFNANGTLNRTYALPGDSGEDFALNLDPNGTDFWTSDAGTGRVWEINIATGAIDNTWLTGNPGITFGLAVFGEITTSGPPSTTPEPTSVFLLGTVASLVAFKFRKKLS